MDITIAASVAATNPHVTHTCGTLFQFSSHAKEEIVRSFVAAASEDVRCDFDEDYLVIRCPKDDDESVPLLLQHLRSFIQTENEKEPDMFEDARVTRVQGTVANRRGSRSKEPASQQLDELVECKRNEDPMLLDMADVEVSDDAGERAKSDYYRKFNNKSLCVTQDTFLIAHETFTRTWTPDAKGGLINFKSRDQTLGHIGSLCECRLEFSTATDTNPVIIIKSDSEQNVDKAIDKLLKLDAATRKQLDFPHIFSYPVVEAKMSVMLQITALKNLNDERLNTTLLPGNTPLLKILGNASVISMMQGGKILPVKQSALQKTSAGIALWKEHPYKEYGIESTTQTVDGFETPLALAAPTVLCNVLADKLATPTGQWLQQNPSEYEDAFKPAKIEVQQQPGDTDRGISLAIPEPTRLPTKRLRIPRGASKAVDTAMPASSNAAASMAEPPLKAPAKTSPTINGVPNLTDQMIFSNVENLQPSQASGAPKIEPPYMPPLAKSRNPITLPKLVVTHSATSTTTPTTITSNSSRSTAWEGTIVQEAKGGELIEPQAEPRETANPKKVFRHTMGQRKPKQPISGSSVSMMKDFEAAAKQLLSLALPRRGPIIFKVGIGRLLINPQTNGPQIKKPFAVSDWRSAFPIRREGEFVRETTFTPRLTARALDIESILDMRLSQGRKLFQDEPQERNVTYSIFCTTKNHDKVVLEVREDGSFKIKGSAILIGAIDWHYPLRSWDSRLHVTSHEPLLSDYQQQAQRIVDHMKVQNRVDGKAIQFSTTTIDEVLTIHSVILRRETTHSSAVYPDLLLHLSEVQDLAVEKLAGTENQYQGSIYVPARMISSRRLWWEASVTSIHATKVLRENDTLELGEIAKWSPESIISRDVMKDMYALAYELVTRMDYVGFYNKAVTGDSDLRTGTRSRTSAPTSSAEW